MQSKNYFQVKYSRFDLNSITCTKMLRSLEIQNYRNLKHLTIERLGRVNLLLGKNNTGKTSVLEAASILIHKANPQWLYRLLEARGEISYNTFNGTSEYLLSNHQAISNLFYGRRGAFQPEEGIKIRQILNKSSKDADKILLRFSRYIEEIDEHKNRISRTLIDDDIDGNSKIGLDIATAEGARLISLEQGFGRPTNFLGLKENVQLVRTNEIIRDINGQLWDKISLTKSEDEIINALKIIEQDIDRITFRNENGLERIPVVKLISSNDVVPLRAMGDGINRILTIILAMVNCENGYFLIDEFENGLHYSVQEQLWKVVFNVAERLNIQVFATTHSHDCIEAFANVLDSEQQKKDFGYMIRLDNYDGNIEAILYDSDEIQATTRVHVDPR